MMSFKESFFKEKSRVKWMKEDDRNTKFFHKTIKVHNGRNKILRLQNEEGIMIEDYSQVQAMAADFFEKLVY